MPMSRAELTADLYQLRAAVPLWRRALPTPEEFSSKYQELSARVLAAADEEDRDWVRVQLSNLLPEWAILPKDPRSSPHGYSTP